MSIPESVVASVASDISERMEDAQYSQLAVGTFLQRHPDIGRYVTAWSKKLPSDEAVVHAVFHAHVLEECFRRHRGRDAEPVTFAHLDAASTEDPVASLSEQEPALAAYIVSNVETQEVHRLLGLVGLALARA